jgi:hypothetical protein
MPMHPRVTQLVEALRFKPEGRGSTTNGVIGIFIYIILPVALDSGVDSTSNRDEYQEYFLKGQDS